MSTFIFQGMELPQELEASLIRYAQQRIETGGFLRAVLENNLKEAVGRADHKNMKILPAIVAYIYNELPSICWGSPEKVEGWLSRAKERMVNIPDEDGGL